MTCPTCRHENHPGARLCAQCGSELAATCGDRAECERQLREARRSYAAMEAAGHAERIAARLSLPPT
jgi:predicted amidophosphoribosyltransferase